MPACSATNFLLGWMITKYPSSAPKFCTPNLSLFYITVPSTQASTTKLFPPSHLISAICVLGFTLTPPSMIQRLHTFLFSSHFDWLKKINDFYGRSRQSWNFNPNQEQTIGMHMHVVGRWLIGVVVALDVGIEQRLMVESFEFDFLLGFGLLGGLLLFWFHNDKIV